MAASIISLVALIVPTLIKLLWFIIEKKENSDELKRDMIKLIDSLNRDKEVPIRLHDRYNDQVERIRDQLRKEEGKV